MAASTSKPPSKPVQAPIGQSGKGICALVRILPELCSSLYAAANPFVKELAAIFYDSEVF